MEFLQRSKRQADRPQERLSTKRQQDRRREERTFHEISSYFAAAKDPTAGTDTNRQDVGRSHAKGLPSRANPQPDRRHLMEQDHVPYFNRQSSIPDATHFLEKPFLGFGRQASLPTKNRTPATRTEGTEAGERLKDTASGASGPATTYLTWSESVVSPNPGNRLRQRPAYSVHERSSTPESVRQAIAKTGVFRDTGLQRHVSLPASHEIRARLRNLQEDAEQSSQSQLHSTRLGSPSNDIGVRERLLDVFIDEANANTNGREADRSSDVTGRVKEFDLSRFLADVARENFEVPREPIQAIRTGKRTPPQSKVHHYDPEAGWHQGQGDEEPKISEKDSASKRLFRTELAQTAYVRPQSTNVSRNVDATELPENASVKNSVPQMNRPATAPPKFNIPVERPYSTAATMSAALPSREVRFPVRPMAMPDLGTTSTHGEPLQDEHHQPLEVNSLPSLNDHVGSSTKRTESAPSARSVRFHEPENPLPSFNTSAYFGLPIRGARTAQNPDPPILRVPSASITDPHSIYGQQLEREHLDAFRNMILSPAIHDDILEESYFDIDFEREKDSVRGQDDQFQEQENEYAEYQNIEIRDAMVNDMDFAITEDDADRSDRPQYLNGDFQEDFQAYEYQRQVPSTDNQENIFSRNDWNERADFETGAYQPYREEDFPRKDSFGEQQEAERLLAGFWQPYRHY